MSNDTKAIMTNDNEHWDLVLQPKNKLLDLKWWDYPEEFIVNNLPFDDIEK